MLDLLDLRERGERLEAVRPEIDPTVSETVQRILQRVFVEGDEVLIELAQRFDEADLSESGLMVRSPLPTTRPPAISNGPSTR